MKRSNPRERILVTSALPYVNNVPHMGNIIGCVLSADVFARYHRSRGDDVMFVCGTDEHGTTTEAKAAEEGLTPRQVCDKYHAIHAQVYAWFDISFDIFGRTSAENHHAIVQAIYKDLKERQLIIEKEVAQAYCPKDKKFLADRFVEGTCPHCAYKNARGDQCESCGRLLDPLELKDPKCKTCGTTPVQKASTHLFLDLPKLQPQLEEWFAAQAVAGRWTENAGTTTRAWLDKGLEPRAITRDLEWGVPVPGLPGKVFYVWFDAPIGYISITGQKKGVSWEDWWLDHEVKLYQFMAKDNIPFHTILFPATLLGTGKPWTMLHHINATEYLQWESGKFSKSRGIGLFGDDAMATGLPADAFRYYLLINRPQTADTTFTWDDLQEKLNSELLANLGNLVNRTLQFVAKYQDGIVTERVLDEKARNFWEWVMAEEELVARELDWAQEKEALKRVMTISSKANAYFQEEQPWKTRTEDPDRCAQSLFILTNIVKDLSILLAPFLPQTAARIAAQLGMEPRTWHDLGELSFSGTIGTPEPLFTKLEDKELAAIRAQTAKAPEAAKPLQVRVGRIVDVHRHPKADKLYVEQVDFGGELRTIVSGLVQHYPAEELRGKLALFVTNLAPATLRGVASQGMILAAEGEDGALEVLTADAEAGTYVLGNGTEDELTIDEFKAHTLEVKDGRALADNEAMTVDGTPVALARVKNGKVR